jgi:DNA invertase Pin-like site-specific DNA recombinase
MTTITADHLTRSAIVYIRQSTAYQVTNNVESGRRQYGLVERARQLGWNDVQVIDDDLGRSGGGITRPGFEKLLAAICKRRVGAVFSIEASRLARNGRDWHTLLEFCGLVGTLIVDEDGIYDPRMPNDRLVLGMKGTMSEMEVSIFRQRSIEAMKQKARRGELFLTVAVGYVKTDDDRIELIADRRVRDAIGLVFSKFAELQTVRQVLVWMRREQVVLPAIVPGPGERPLEWKLPVYHTLHHILTNPVYAGAYVFGRRGARVTIEAGRKRVIRSLRRNWSDWEVLIKRPPRRIRYVGGVRKESAADCGQCQRDELFGAGLCPSGWSAVAGPVPLCPLWPEAPSIVWRQQDLLSALCLPWGF